MKTTRSILVAALALGLAGTASAAGKGPTLSAGGRTLTGPGAVALDAGISESVFSSASTRDVCITVVNTGKVTVSVNVNGTLSFDVPGGEAGSRCADAVTAVDILCPAGKQSCAAQWRVDNG